MSLETAKLEDLGERLNKLEAPVYEADRPADPEAAAIEGQIGARQPVLVWLEPRDDAEQREAKLRALGKLKPGQRVHFVSWKTRPEYDPSREPDSQA